MKYPFLDKDKITGDDYIDERANRVAKLRAYHDNRAEYEEIIQQYPGHRLASDKKVSKSITKHPTKVARSARLQPAPIKQEGENDQLDFFNR